MKAASNDNPLNRNSRSATAEGWETLFDGVSLNGWHVYNKKSDGAAWKVADGALYLDVSKKSGWQTVGGGDLVTDKEFTNFHLQLEWKVAKGGNSGIMFYVQESPQFEHTWHTGPEMQLLDNAAHSDADIHKHRAGDLYDLIAGNGDPVRPAGQWNAVDIISSQGRLEFILNDVSFLKTTLWDDNWKQLIEGSKFKKWPDFGTFRSGKIALQDHGDPVWFRNIRILNF